MRPGQAKGPSVGSNGGGGGGGGAVDTVAGLFPIVVSDGSGPDAVVSFAGITTPGTAGQSIRMNVGGTAFEYYTPLTGDVTGVTGTTPVIVTSGTGPVPNVTLAGLTTVGAANDFVSSNGSAWAYVGSTGSGLVARQAAPTFTGTVTMSGTLSVTGVIEAIVAGTPLLGLFGTAAVAQPTYTGTAVPNPVLDTTNFINRMQEVVSGLLAIGALRSV
jgi:hypothetical protein